MDGATTHAVAWLTHPVVACWNLSAEQARRLERDIPGWRVTRVQGQADFLAALPLADVALVWRFEQDWFALAPKLKRVITPSAGREAVAVHPPAGVEVWNSGFHGELMAETVVALILGHFRGVIAMLRESGDPWPQAALSRVMRPLRGHSVTIVGYGRIGAWIARLLAPFGVRLTGIRRRPGAVVESAAPGVEVEVCGVERLDTVLEATDVLVLCAPATAETDRLLDARRLARLPSRAIIVNVGRGNAIDEEALVAALRAGRLEAAYLDVARVEPVPADSPLRQCPGVTLMPHASAIATNYLDLFCAELQRRMVALDTQCA